MERADELTAAVELAFAFDSKAVVEEEIPGFEVGCAVIGNRELFIGEVDEVALGERWLDYEEKYGNRTAEIRLPARISPESRDKIRDTAAVLYQALGCRGFARVDMFLTPPGTWYSMKSTPFQGSRPTAGIPKCWRRRECLSPPLPSG